jgi:hypothetical protein
MTENENQTDSPESGDPGEPQLSEEERQMLEEQMREVRVEDLLTQTVASVLNLSARRILKEDEVDLDQARTGIEAVRALVPLLPPDVGEAIREPLSQVQMLYAQRSGGGTDTGSPEASDEASGPGQAPPDQPPPPKGPGLWTPGGS